MTWDWIPALAGVALRHPNVDLYVFGSTVYGDRAPNDLDVLAVYSTIEDYYAFAAELERLEFSPLVDVVAMASDEVRGSGFLRRSNAVALNSLVAGQHDAHRADHSFRGCPECAPSPRGSETTRSAALSTGGHATGGLGAS